MLVVLVIVGHLRLTSGRSLHPVAQRFPLPHQGPLAVRPLFVHKQDRVRGMVWATMVALQLFALLELQAHQARLTISGQTLNVTCRTLMRANVLRFSHVCAARLVGLRRSLVSPCAPSWHEDARTPSG